jgi:hypothetical protein
VQAAGVHVPQRPHPPVSHIESLSEDGLLKSKLHDASVMPSRLKATDGTIPSWPDRATG